MLEPEIYWNIQKPKSKKQVCASLFSKSSFTSIALSDSCTLIEVPFRSIRKTKRKYLPKKKSRAKAIVGQA